MSAIELTAKNVTEAQKAAAEKLGVALENVTITVLEETKGLFGKSHVRVRAEATAPAASVPAAPAPAPVAPAVTETPVAEIQSAMEAPAPDAKKPRRGGKKAAPPKPEEPIVPAEEPVAVEAPKAEAAESEIVATEADAEALVSLLKELLESANLNIHIGVASIQGRYVNISVDGKDSSFLVGKHGEVLNALQYLVNIVGGRRFDNGIRATLECNDYRRRREEVLTNYAQKIAEQVKKRGEEALLDALPAFERRIVHKALSTIDGIQTYSEGEEPNRRVVIAPAD